MGIDRYGELKKISDKFINTKIVAYIPTPDDTDYKRGYIVRYFIQKTNDILAPIYEIKKESVSKFNTNPFYVVVDLDWRLTGSIDDVKESNSISVRIASESMKNLQLYLPNLLQFYKNNLDNSN